MCDYKNIGNEALSYLEKVPVVVSSVYVGVENFGATICVEVAVTAEKLSVQRSPDLKLAAFTFNAKIDGECINM